MAQVAVGRYRGSFTTSRSVPRGFALRHVRVHWPVSANAPCIHPRGAIRRGCYASADGGHSRAVSFSLRELRMTEAQLSEGILLSLRLFGIATLATALETLYFRAALLVMIRNQGQPRRILSALIGTSFVELALA